MRDFTWRGPLTTEEKMNEMVKNLGPNPNPNHNPNTEEKMNEMDKNLERYTHNTCTLKS